MAIEPTRGDLVVSPTTTIPSSDLSWSASRAGGPGGQHVNKTSTKVDLRFDLEGSRALTPWVKTRLRELARGKLDADGRLVITSSGSRSQTGNLEEARARLANFVRSALVIPKRRRPTRPSLGAKRRRLQGKRETAEKKAGRRKVDRD